MPVRPTPKNPRKPIRRGRRRPRPPASGGAGAGPDTGLGRARIARKRREGIRALKRTKKVAQRREAGLNPNRRKR